MTDAVFSVYDSIAYLNASSIATATATVIPTMGLLPAPIKPIISTLERELYEKSLMCYAKSNARTHRYAFVLYTL